MGTTDPVDLGCAGVWTTSGRINVTNEFSGRNLNVSTSYVTRHKYTHTFSVQIHYEHPYPVLVVILFVTETDTQSFS